MNPEHYKKLLIWIYGNNELFFEEFWEDTYIQIIEEALDTLDSKRKRILRARLEGQTLKQVGLSENLSRERIRRIQHEALRRLRDPQRLDLYSYIQSKYLCEMINSGEMKTRSYEFEGETRTYQIEREKCQLCGFYEDEPIDRYDGYGCPSKQQSNSRTNGESQK